MNRITFIKGICIIPFVNINTLFSPHIWKDEDVYNRMHVYKNGIKYNVELYEHSWYVSTIGCCIYTILKDDERADIDLANYLNQNKYTKQLN